MVQDCLFCKIIKGDIPAEKVFENDKVLAFKDINPIAKIHLLFVHKEHTQNINNMVETDPEQLIDIYKAVKEFTENQGVDKEGFRLLSNLGKFAGQTVFHTHFHLLGGEPLRLF